MKKRIRIRKLKLNERIEEDINIIKNKILNLQFIQYLNLSVGAYLFIDLNYCNIEIIYNIFKFYNPNMLSFYEVCNKFFYLKNTIITHNVKYYN
jgi:hypothetical protein